MHTQHPGFFRTYPNHDSTPLHPLFFPQGHNASTSHFPPVQLLLLPTFVGDSFHSQYSCSTFSSYSRHPIEVSPLNKLTLFVVHPQFICLYVRVNSRLPSHPKEDNNRFLEPANPFFPPPHSNRRTMIQIVPLYSSPCTDLFQND